MPREEEHKIYKCMNRMVLAADKCKVVAQYRSRKERTTACLFIERGTEN